MPTGKLPITLQSRITLTVFMVVLFIGGGIFGVLSGHSFWVAQGHKSQLEQHWKNRNQPGNAQAEGVRSIVGLMSGFGLLGMDTAAVVEILTHERNAWRYCSAALALLFTGLLVRQRVKRPIIRDENEIASSPMVVIADSQANSAQPGLRDASPSGRRLVLPMVLGCSLLALAVLAYLWSTRPDPTFGVALSGNLGEILSQEHYQLIERGMTLEDVSRVLEVGDQNAELIRSSQQTMNSMRPGKATWLSLDNADGSHFIAIRVLNGRVIAKRFHRLNFNAPTVDLSDWNEP